jgi:hypothetical protein
MSYEAGNPLEMVVQFICEQLGMAAPADAAEGLDLLREERFDLVHAHMPISGVLGRSAARSVGVPRIAYTCHGFLFNQPGPLWRRGLSLGDAACLATAAVLRLPVLTADRAWAGLGLELDIRLIR